jgi:hypothetical protein
MQAASLFDGFSFDLFPPIENGLTAPEVDVSRHQVVRALVVSRVGVVLDELLDAVFELSWQVVVLQQDPVFHRAVISLDLALRHRVVRPPNHRHRGTQRCEGRGAKKVHFFGGPQSGRSREALVPRGPFRFLVTATDRATGHKLDSTLF